MIPAAAAVAALILTLGLITHAVIGIADRRAGRWVDATHQPTDLEQGGTR